MRTRLCTLAPAEQCTFTYTSQKAQIGTSTGPEVVISMTSLRARSMLCCSGMTRIESLLGVLLFGAILAQPACGATSFSSDEEAGAGNDAGSGGSGASGASGGKGGTTGSGGSGVGGSAGRAQGGAAGSVAGRGGSAGAGANGGQAGTAAGSAGLGGSGGCGFCPAVACVAPMITLMVSAESPTSGIQDLVAESTELGLTCSASGVAPCQWYCESQLFGVSSGSHSITLSAPGYETQTVEFEIVNPTCGCCGCGCGPYVQMPVTLKPNGDPVGNCCANLSTDPTHCGECGNTCSGSVCSQGACEGQGGAGGSGGTAGSAGEGGASNCSPPLPPESDPECPDELSTLQSQPCNSPGMECYHIDALSPEPCSDGYYSTNALCCDGAWQVSTTTYPPGSTWLQPICALSAN
jgi:hypothetical protein